MSEWLEVLRRMDTIIEQNNTIIKGLSIIIDKMGKEKKKKEEDEDDEWEDEEEETKIENIPNKKTKVS